MKTVIFMNHRIREKKPSGPVIRAVRGKKITESNCLKLMFAGKEVGRVIYDPKNNPSTTHEVKAWVEWLGDVK